MTRQLAKKLLMIATGVLLLLVAALTQIRSQKTQENSESSALSPQESGEARPDPVALLQNSLMQQKRNFQRCWLKSSEASKANSMWQIFLVVESSGRVRKFELLNRAFFDAETEKCLRNTVLRMKLPSFEGDEVAFTIPITVAPVNENR
ncbi:MAG: hypothetical protein ACK5Y2_08795 [Bdellovibrionales bacterium]